MPQNSSSPKSGPDFQMFCRCLWFAAKLLSSYPHNTAFTEWFWHMVIHFLCAGVAFQRYFVFLWKTAGILLKKKSSWKKPDPLIWERKKLPPKFSSFAFSFFSGKKTKTSQVKINSNYITDAWYFCKTHKLESTVRYRMKPQATSDKDAGVSSPR